MISMQEFLICNIIISEVIIMRYEDITGVDEINAGANGQVKDAQYISDFLTGWSEWLAEIITTIKDFFDKIMYAIQTIGE